MRFEIKTAITNWRIFPDAYTVAMSFGIVQTGQYLILYNLF